MRTRFFTIMYSFALMLLMLPASGAQAQSVLQFPAESALSTGKWVKINFTKSGIYQITYDQLREMGFAEPEKVYVFGYGGYYQPLQFASEDGKPLYETQTAPVATKHLDNKIIFYGQGTERIRQYGENINRPTARQFDLESSNPYAKQASYFLTDSREGKAPVYTASGSFDTRLPIYDTAWTVFYHEIDKTNPILSSREYFGENMTQNPVLTIPYELPGAEAGNRASLSLRLVHNMTSASSSVEFTLAPADEEGEAQEPVSVPMLRTSDSEYYSVNNPVATPATIPGPEGTLTLDYKGTPSWAYLDYFILAAQRRLRFNEGEDAMIVYTGDFAADKYSMVQIENMPQDMLVWDIAAPGDVRELNWYIVGADAYVRYMRPSKAYGVMAAFTPKANFPEIDSWSEVKNTNLHAIGIDRIPGLLIITLPEFLPAAERIAKLHKEMEGIETAIVLHEDVVNEFSAGVDDPMAYRALAKMIYERDDPQNRRFRNMLLLGPNHRDQRGLNIDITGGNLISNQSFYCKSVDDTFTLNDWYGMMEDVTAYTPQSTGNTFARVPVQIGVGNVPARNLADAMNYVEKLEQFYADDSYAYWLADANYIADAGDDNEHQNSVDLLHHNMTLASGGVSTGNKLYLNIYPYRGATKAFLHHLKEGSMMNYYLGHSSTAGLSSEFWNMKDASLLANHRLGFMTMASCTVTAFDMNLRGAGEVMVFQPKTGMVGAFTTTRSGYSQSNYQLADYFQRACFVDELSNNPLNDYKKPLSAPRTIGEIYAMAKTAYKANSNEHAFVLLSDPALTLPLPTNDIKLTLTADGEEIEEFYPHQQLQVSGRITSRDGQLRSDFNGDVVAKIYNPPTMRMTTPRVTTSPAVEVELDENPIATLVFPAVNGEFSGTITMPLDLAKSVDTNASMRLAAYNPANRMAAAGVVSLKANDYTAEKAVAEDSAPAIDRMYPNSPDIAEGQLVAPSFMLCAEISDDHGIKVFDSHGITGIKLNIDDKSYYGDVNRYVRLSDGGRSAKLAYPVEGLTEGVHTFTLFVSDTSGNTAMRTVSVNVGTPYQLSGRLADIDEPARESATFTFLSDNDEADMQRSIVIMDAAGNEVYSGQMPDSQFDWDLLNNDGERVSTGIYYALVRMSGPALTSGATAPVKFIVF